MSIIDRNAMGRYDFLIETYDTERLKTLSVWTQVPADRMSYRSEPRARSPLEHMVHQCMSEEGWMTAMLGINVSRPVLPAEETLPAFLEHYAAVSLERLEALSSKPDDWFEGSTQFFDVVRSRAWVMVRRIAHSAHHRGQLTAYVRSWGDPLYSTYGPTADTGGLTKDGAVVIYPFDSVDDLLAGGLGRSKRSLPGLGAKPPTERG